MKIRSVLLRMLPDSLYLKYRYRKLTGKQLNLENPQTFNEKIQWLKLHDRDPKYTRMVDKYEVKEYVASIIGEEYIIPTLGVWDRFEDIDLDSLPDQFVLKCTHDSGGLIICRDKSTFDRQAAQKTLRAALKNNFFWAGREWPYKNVRPRILAERYMEDSSCPELKDYKFYVFNGEPKFLYLAQGLENHATARRAFLTLDWTLAPYTREGYKPFESLPPRPENLEKMIELAGKLSQGLRFLRVDFYEINGDVYFGELTFYPASGFTPFADPKWDREIGSFLKI